MRNYGKIRKLVAFMVEVVVVRLLTFLFLYLPIKRILMISPGVCADFDFNLLCFHFYFSHGTFFCFLRFLSFKDQLLLVLGN